MNYYSFISEVKSVILERDFTLVILVGVLVCCLCGNGNKKTIEGIVNKATNPQCKVKESKLVE